MKWYQRKGLWLSVGFEIAAGVIGLIGWLYILGLYIELALAIALVTLVGLVAAGVDIDLSI